MFLRMCILVEKFSFCEGGIKWYVNNGMYNGWDYCIYLATFTYEDWAFGKKWNLWRIFVKNSMFYLWVLLFKYATFLCDNNWMNLLSFLICFLNIYALTLLLFLPFEVLRCCDKISWIMWCIRGYGNFS